MRVCAGCGHGNGDAARFCEACGAALGAVAPFSQVYEEICA